MSLNYNIKEIFNLLKNAFKYDMFYGILIGSILLTIVLILNKDKKITKYIVCGINFVLVILISFYYIKDISTFKFSNPLNNMYFYFFSSIIYLILMSLINFKTKYQKINYIIYGVVLIGLFYSLFMTHYLKNIDLIVIGNIYPMIKIGNIVYIIYYVLVLINFIKNRFLTKEI